MDDHEFALQVMDDDGAGSAITSIPAGQSTGIKWTPGPWPTSKQEVGKMNTCKCGQPGTEVCYRRGSRNEIWFCGSRKHRSEIRELTAQSWLSQSAAVASSATGTAVRRHLQS